LRPLSYPNTDVIIICYDVTNYSSYENVTTKWVPETSHHCPGVPMVLVACKTDLRRSPDNQQNTTHVIEDQSGFISTQDVGIASMILVIIFSGFGPRLLICFGDQES